MGGLILVTKVVRPDCISWVMDLMDFHMTDPQPNNANLLQCVTSLQNQPFNSDYRVGLNLAQRGTGIGSQNHSEGPAE